MPLYYAKDAFYLDNGRGRANWRIGQPQVLITNAYQGRSQTSSLTLPNLS